MQSSALNRGRVFFQIILLGAAWGLMNSTLAAQGPEAPAQSPQQTEPDDEEVLSVPAKVDVNPVARDEEIRERLQNVLDATDWFTKPQVEVEQGVVFLSGQAQTDDRKKWAGDLARNTQDVVAVVNRMDVIQPSIWDFSQAWNGLLTLWRDIIVSLPLVLFGLFVLSLSIWFGVLVTRRMRSVLQRRVKARLLRNVIARAIGLVIILAGVYIILRVAGLTQLALTVVGGTGLLGLIVGIAFRDITENFLASIFLSMQKPFETGDLVEITGETGYVQQLNIRTTVLMTLDGNLVQIPNGSVYKNNLKNFTTNSNRREDFLIGIGYDDSIIEAQEIARKVMEEHPAVLADPEPWVLVDSLGAATVNLKVYFWLNGREHSWLKVRSSVIRLIKLAFQKQGISMPDEAREIVFPQGIPVTMIENPQTKEHDGRQRKRLPEESLHKESQAVSTKAEGGFSSEAAVIEEQARQAQPLHEGENLLQSEPKS